MIVIETYDKKNKMKINASKTQIRKFNRYKNFDFPSEVTLAGNHIIEEYRNNLSFWEF